MNQTRISNKLERSRDRLQLPQGFAIIICKFKRAHFRIIFREFSVYDYSASKDETYYDYKLKRKVAINSQDVITGVITVRTVSIDERGLLSKIINKIKRLQLADKDLMTESYKQQLNNEIAINLQIFLSQNVGYYREKNAHVWFVLTYPLIGTLIEQLSGHFDIEKDYLRKYGILLNYER